MRYRLGIHGSTGKMGAALQLASTALREEIEELVLYKRGEDIKTFVEKSNIILDFSNSAATANLLTILQHTPKPILIGTTALSDTCIALTESVATQAPVMVAPNTS